jgi:GNAT superfamily N-acetyltransferase
MAHPVTFRRYRETDYGPVASLWTRINRELAPAGMEELFEQYIATSIDGELKRVAEIFSEAKRNAFWVVEGANQIVGSFGIESRSVSDTELRRMYLDEGFRGSGIAQRMLDFAQAEARALGFTKMILSTAQIQKAADRFLSKEWIYPNPNGGCRGHDDQAGGRWLDPVLFRESALIAADSALKGHRERDRRGCRQDGAG